MNSSYAPDRFVGDLDHALMRLADPKDIVAVTVGMLGQYAEVDRCDYAEVVGWACQFAKQLLGHATDAVPSASAGV